MPIYEYACETCGDRFEVKQSVKDAPIAACSRCGGPVRKLISSPAIMFKGSGWYITDYSDKLKPPAGDGAAPAAETQKDAAAPAAAPSAPASPPAPTGAAAASAPASSTSSSSTAK